MGMISFKQVNHNFFKTWTSEMSYVLGYITADGCIYKRKDRKNGYMFNITSKDKLHLSKINKALGSNFKIGIKYNSQGNQGSFAHQFIIQSSEIFYDLMNLGIFPRKTYNLKSIEVPEKYFSHFVRGFFDGDGSVYIYKVNGTPQIKSSFVSASLSFITHFNQHLCSYLNIVSKIIHKNSATEKRMAQYSVCFYIDDCNKLAEFMYGNNPTLYLPRKRQIFEKWKLIERRHYIKQDYPSKIGLKLNEKIFA